MPRFSILHKIFAKLAKSSLQLLVQHYHDLSILFQAQRSLVKINRDLPVFAHFLRVGGRTDLDIIGNLSQVARQYALNDLRWLSALPHAYIGPLDHQCIFDARQFIVKEFCFIQGIRPCVLLIALLLHVHDVLSRSNTRLALEHAVIMVLLNLEFLYDVLLHLD